MPRLGVQYRCDACLKEFTADGYYNHDLNIRVSTYNANKDLQLWFCNDCQLKGEKGEVLTVACHLSLKIDQCEFEY